MKALSVLFALGGLLAAAQQNLDGFIPRTYGKGRDVMPYRLFVPAAYDAQKRYPLVIWLHGGGGAGTDNLRQIQKDQVPGTRLWTRPATQAKYPAFVLVPQSATGWGAQPKSRRVSTLSPPLSLVVGIMDVLQSEFSIDRDRVYVAGQSDGGYAVWEIISKHPERFAGAIALCGGGSPDEAPRAARVPVWAFHGDLDLSIPVSESRMMVSAIRAAGGNPRYSEYKGMGHDIWTRAFAEPELVDWLFAQHK